MLAVQKVLLKTAIPSATATVIQNVKAVTDIDELKFQRNSLEASAAGFTTHCLCTLKAHSVSTNACMMSRQSRRQIYIPPYSIVSKLPSSTKPKEFLFNDGQAYIESKANSGHFNLTPNDHNIITRAAGAATVSKNNDSIDYFHLPFMTHHYATFVQIELDDISSGSSFDIDTCINWPTKRF